MRLKATTRVAAAAATQVDQPVLEDAAAQVLVEVALDELRQAGLLGGAPAEGQPVLAHHLVKERLAGSLRRPELRSGARTHTGRPVSLTTPGSTRTA